MRLLLTLTFIAAITLAGLQAAKPTTADFTGALPLLLTSEKVRDDLKLNSLQRVVLDSLRAEYKTESRAIVATQPKTPEERKITEAKLATLTKKYNSRALSALSDHQANELLGIQHALLKGFALTLPAVQEKLQLNSEQKAQIATIAEKLATHNGKVNKDFEAGKISPFERTARLNKFRLEQSAALENVLTPEQLSKFQSFRKKA